MRRVKKGMTILEIVIGLAIIGIMLVPLANGLLTSVRANKKAEETQQAKLLGQQVVEKLKIQNKIENGEDISFHNTDLIIDNAVNVGGTTNRKFEIKSKDEVNGYMIDGEIIEAEVIAINEDSYVGAGIKAPIDIYINLDTDETGNIKIRIMEGKHKELDELLAMKDSIEGTPVDVGAELFLNVDLGMKKITEGGEQSGTQITSKCGKINRFIPKISNGVVLFYINGIKGIQTATEKKPSINIEVVNNSIVSEEVQILRDISVSKEDFIDGLKVELGENINSYNNVIYDSTNSKKGLYTVNLEVKKKDEKVEKVSSQFYLER